MTQVDFDVIADRPGDLLSPNLSGALLR